MTFKQLVKEFIKHWNKSPEWSALDRLEVMAIEMFADWLDKKYKVVEKNHL